MSEPYAHLAFDFKLMRPGCVLLQALHGCITADGGNPANDFPSEAWLVAPTPDLKVYSIGTKEQYENIVHNYEDMRSYAANREAAAQAE